MWPTVALAALAAERRAAGPDDRGATLLHGGEESGLEPLLVVDQLGGASAARIKVLKRSGYWVAE